jgi:hypothetical protein
MPSLKNQLKKKWQEVPIRQQNYKKVFKPQTKRYIKIADEKNSAYQKLLGTTNVPRTWGYKTKKIVFDEDDNKTAAEKKKIQFQASVNQIKREHKILKNQRKKKFEYVIKVNCKIKSQESDLIIFPNGYTTYLNSKKKLSLAQIQSLAQNDFKRLLDELNSFNAYGEGDLRIKPLKNKRPFVVKERFHNNNRTQTTEYTSRLFRSSEKHLVDYQLGNDEDIQLINNGCMMNNIAYHMRKNKKFSIKYITEWFKNEIAEPKHLKPINNGSSINEMINQKCYEYSHIKFSEEEDTDIIVHTETIESRKLENINNGITIELQIAFFEHHKISYYIFNDEQRLITGKTFGSNTNYKPFYAKVSGNHQTYIGNEDIIQKITNLVRKDGEILQTPEVKYNPELPKKFYDNIDEVIKEKDSINFEETTNIFLNQQLTETSLRKLVEETHLKPSSIKCNKDLHVIFFILGNTRFYFSPEFETIYNALNEKMKEKNIDPAIKMIINEMIDPAKNLSAIMDAFLELHNRSIRFHKSSPNEEGLYFLDQALVRAPYYYSDEKKGFSIDFNKLYSAILMNKFCMSGIPIYNIFDQVLPFDKDTDEIICGFYQIDIRVNIIPDKLSIPHNCIISDELVKCLLKNKYIKRKNIVKKYISSKRLEPTWFKTTIQDIYDTCGDKLAKNIVNQWNGCQNKGAVSSTKTLFCESLEDALFYMNSAPNEHQYFRTIEMIDKYYFLKEKQEKVKYEHTRPIYLKVISMNWIAMIELYKKMKKKNPEINQEIIKIKVDSIATKTEVLSDDDFSEDIGGIKKEDYKYVKKINVTEPEFIEMYVKEDIECKKDDIPMLLSKNKGFCVYGEAGTGKTTLTKDIRKHTKKIGKKVLATALTRAACFNLKKKSGFKNVYTLAHIFDRTKSLEYNISKIVNKYDYLLVDEFSMVTEEYAKKLFILKMKYDFPIILIGDNNQLPPPEGMKTKLFRTQVFSTLCSRRYIQLTENFRQKDDPKFVKTMRKFIKTGRIDKIFKQKHENETVLNIAYRNIKCDEINQKFKDKNKKDENHIVIGKKQKHKVIVKGTILCSVIDNIESEIMKNQLFEVVSWDDDFNFKLIDISTKEEYEFEKKQIRDWFKMGHAITAYGCQGLTLDMNITVYEADFVHFSRECLYTIMTRVTNTDQLALVGNYWKKTYELTDNVVKQFEITKNRGSNIKYKNACVYVLRNKKNKVKYVGSTINSEERKKEHKITYPDYTFEVIKEMRHCPSEEMLRTEEVKFIHHYQLLGCKLKNQLCMLSDEQLNNNLQFRPYSFESIKEKLDNLYKISTGKDSKGKYFVITYKNEDNKSKKTKVRYNEKNKEEKLAEVEKKAKELTK